MSLKTEKLRDYLEDEYPIDVLGIFIDRTGIRIQYREISFDDLYDRHLRKAQLIESTESFIKKAAYLDGRLDRNSKMMMQLNCGEVTILIQRVSNNIFHQASGQYRVRQDVIRNTENQYVFATKYFSVNCKELADLTSKTLRNHTCPESERKYIIELQYLNESNQYTAYATFHTNDAYSTIMEKKSSD